MSKTTINLSRFLRGCSQLGDISLLGIVLNLFQRLIFFEPVHVGVLRISSANLFAIGITIDIAIGFIFLLFFILWGLAPPSMKIMRKIKTL